MVARFQGALIGCGFFAQNHMHAWSEIEEAEIVAVCDTDESRAKAMAERFGIGAIYTSAAQMLSDLRLDFVDIATTPPSHRPLVELAAEAGVGAICQKPFAETIEDGEAMVSACRKAGVPLQVHENFRYQKPFRVLASLVAEGAVGTVQFARLSFRHRYDNYRNQPYLAQIERFSIMDVGLHLFDLVRHLVGETDSLFCRTQSLNPIVRGEDAFSASLHHVNGAISTIDCSFFASYSPEPFPETVAVIEGDEGTLELLRGYRLVAHTRHGKKTFDVEPEIPAWGTRPWHAVQESVLALQRRWIDVLGGKVAPAPSGEDNLRTLSLAFAAYKSAETDERVPVHGDLVP